MISRGFSSAMHRRRRAPDGRTIAAVFLPDDTNVNHTLVKNCWCWWYKKYAPGNVTLEGLESEAREAKKGKRSRWCCAMRIISRKVCAEGRRCWIACGEKVAQK
jgi:endonuclease YncB( thermonuclease family)